MDGRVLSAEEEFTELKAKAEAGDASSMHKLYLAYLDGFGTEKDEDEAFPLAQAILLAWRRGDAEAASRYV